MTTRSTIIAVLVVIELAIIGEAVVAVRGGQSFPPFAQRGEARSPSGPRLIEGGPHQVFDAGAHPMLTVDIGYADLTILTNSAPQIDVSLSETTTSGLFNESAPIVAREDGQLVRIADVDSHGWATGDDRMVTVLVPPETQVTVVEAGDIKASGLRAEASLKSVGSGTITVEDFDAPALQVASRGSITLRRIVAAHLDAKSRGDSVEGSALQVRNGSIDSDDQVTLGFAAGADTLVSAVTKDGKISTSGFPETASADADKSSQDNDDGASQRVRVGAGEGRLDVRTSDGDIKLAEED